MGLKSPVSIISLLYTELGCNLPKETIELALAILNVNMVKTVNISDVVNSLLETRTAP